MYSQWRLQSNQKQSYGAWICAFEGPLDPVILNHINILLMDINHAMLRAYAFTPDLQAHFVVQYLREAIDARIQAIKLNQFNVVAADAGSEPVFELLLPRLLMASSLLACAKDEVTFSIRSDKACADFLNDIFLPMTDRHITLKFSYTTQSMMTGYLRRQGCAFLSIDPVKYAMARNDNTMLQILLADGSRVNDALIRELREKEDTETLDFLFRKGRFSPDERDEFGIPYLCAAVIGAKHKMTKFLLEHGVNVNAKIKLSHSAYDMTGSAEFCMKFEGKDAIEAGRLMIQSWNDQLPSFMTVYPDISIQLVQICVTEVSVHKIRNDEYFMSVLGNKR